MRLGGWRLDLPVTSMQRGGRNLTPEERILTLPQRRMNDHGARRRVRLNAREMRDSIDATVGPPQQTRPLISAVALCKLSSALFSVFAFPYFIPFLPSFIFFASILPFFLFVVQDNGRSLTRSLSLGRNNSTFG